MLKFKIVREQNKHAAVLKQWPNQPCKLDLYTDKIAFQLQLEKDFHTAMLPVIEVTSKECTEFEVYNIPRWCYGVFRVVLRKYKYVKTMILKERNPCQVTTWSSKQPLMFLCVKSKLGPTFAICCDASSNFYCSYVLNSVLNKILKAIKSKPNVTRDHLISIVQEHFHMKETFEEQYISANALRTSSVEERESDPIIYEYSTERTLEVIDSQERRKEYDEFISAEENGTSDSTKKTMLENKNFIKKLTLFNQAINSLNKLDESYSDVLNQSLKMCLKNQLDELLKKSEDFKCKLCCTNWINCMLPECKHFQFCQLCIEKNVNQYKRFHCPYCKRLNSFIIVDIDIPKSIY